MCHQEETTMIKVIIKVKYPKISYISPFRLSEEYTVQTKEDRLSQINNNFNNLKRWVDAKRNYIT